MVQNGIPPLRDAPSNPDLRDGRLQASFAAAVQDPEAVRRVSVHYGRPRATTRGPYDVQIIRGYGADWTDGRPGDVATILAGNVVGQSNIPHVATEPSRQTALSRVATLPDHRRSLGLFPRAGGGPAHPCRCCPDHRVRQPGRVTMIGPRRVATTVCSYCTTGAAGRL